MMREIYFDNSATTPLSEAVKAKMEEAMEIYGNPSSLHAKGNAAHELLEEARQRVLESLSVRGFGEGKLVFTSCGSEADNLAVLGTAYAKPRRKGMRIITTDSEHAGVKNPMKALEEQGFEVIRISTKGGEPDWEQYLQALNSRVFLVSMMTVNNETGALYDIGKAFALAKAQNPDIVTHTDAVQGYLKCRFSPKALHADLVTLSAHKIHGPKGMGALYLSKDAVRRKDVLPLLLGGGQEDGFRSGTENVIGIAGFGEAAREGFANLTENIRRMEHLRQSLLDRLKEFPVRPNLPKGAHAPHILNLTVPDIRSETLLHELSSKGIYVSNGSACSSHSKQSSSSLISFGLTASEADSSIRISFSEQNTEEELDVFCDALKDALGHLVRVKH